MKAMLVLVATKKWEEVGLVADSDVVARGAV